MNIEALSMVLEKINTRITYALDKNDMGLLRFSIGELEDVIHNLRLELEPKEQVQAPTEDEITAHLEFMGKNNE